jgi:hypothetical protein
MKLVENEVNVVGFMVGASFFYEVVLFMKLGENEVF